MPEKALQKIVVIGNGMTSQSFCRYMTEERDQNSPRARQLFSLQVFGEEPRPAYDRVHLTDFFDGKSPGMLELASREWYVKRGIELRTGEAIQSIDRDNQRVVSSTGERHEYDKLVVATGSRPFVPPIPGVDLDGVFVYRTIEDVQGIANAGQNARSAAVLGGGLLGLEAAKALRDMGLSTHVVEMAPGLMPRQLDRESADELKSRIERIGVNVHLTKRTQSIEKHGDYLIIQFDSGDSISTDMVVVSAGIRPRDELAKESGIEVGHRGGIVVDDRLTTSDASVHAIGECACHRGTVYGLVGPCYQMAKSLADHLHGEDVSFAAADQSAKLKLLGVDVATFGEPIGQSAGSRIVSAKLASGTRKLLIRDRQIVGALGVGEWPEADAVRVAVSELKQPWGWQIRRFRQRGKLFAEGASDDVSQWPPAALICSCAGVKRSDLTTACQQGCSTVEQLAIATGASTVCGSCRPLLARMIGSADVAVEAIAGSRGLFVASVVAIVAIAVMKLLGPIGFSESVVDVKRSIDFFWRDDFWRR